MDELPVNPLIETLQEIPLKRLLVIVIENLYIVSSYVFGKCHACLHYNLAEVLITGVKVLTQLDYDQQIFSTTILSTQI